jgi:hypothetical protein
MAVTSEPITSQPFCQLGDIERQWELYRFFFREVASSKRLEEQYSVAVTGTGARGTRNERR